MNSSVDSSPASMSLAEDLESVESLPTSDAPAPNLVISTPEPKSQSKMGTFDESSYAKHRRALMKLLAELHSTGLQNLLNLPQVAVVGSQSVGKSSLIESISGIKLPRESGTCTRCPMECRLEHIEIGSWTCRVSLRIQDGDSTQELQFGDVLTSPDQVERRIRQAQRALLRPSLEPSVFLDDSDLGMRGGNIMSFTDNCVCIHIRGPDVTDLHFYDLPGIIVNVAEGQDPTDIDLVRSMVRRYISRPGCIILLVVSCETDFENQVAGRLVREVDPSGINTVGVLTKPDKTDAESAPKWQRINDVYRLQTGWYVLKLPDSRELREGISAEVSRQRAEAFFKSSEHWRSYAQQNQARIVTSNLTEYLAERLSDQLRESLPRIREAVQQELTASMLQLAKLPPQLATDPTAEVFAQVTKFAQDVSRHIRGNAALHVHRQGLVQRLYADYATFKKSVRATVPKFDARSGNNSNSEEDPQLVDFDSDDEENEVSYNDVIGIDTVMKVATEARSRELPGNYPFSVKSYYINLFLEKWEVPTFSCFEAAFATFSDELGVIIEEHFGHYSHGGLLSQVQMVVSSQLQELTNDAKADLLLELRKETDTIYTQNDHYLAAYKTKFLSHYKRVLKWKPTNDSTDSAQSSHVANALNYLHSAGFSGVTKTDLVKLLPTDGFEPALDIMAEVRAYFQVAYKRYIDAVPLFIERALIRKFEAQLSTALLSDLGLFEPGARTKCEMWVREPPATAASRRDLLARKKTLEEAQYLLLHFG